MSNKKMRMGYFKRMCAKRKIVKFIRNYVPLRIILLFVCMLVYTMFFIIPEYCPFAVALLLTFKFSYYHYMHQKIHKRAEILGISPVFTGTFFASCLIFAARLTCSKCKEKYHSDAVFKYYKNLSKDDTKNKCSFPLITRFLK